MELELMGWLDAMGFYDDNLHQMIVSECGNIPASEVTRLQQKLNIEPGCKVLLRKLLTDSVGINISDLGMTLEDWDMQDECEPWCILIRKNLIRHDENRGKLKATKPAFNPNIQHLVGILPTL